MKELFQPAFECAQYLKADQNNTQNPVKIHNNCLRLLFLLQVEVGRQALASKGIEVAKLEAITHGADCIYEREDGTSCSKTETEKKEILKPAEEKKENGSTDGEKIETENAEEPEIGEEIEEEDIATEVKEEAEKTKVESNETETKTEEKEELEEEKNGIKTETEEN